MHDRQMRSIPHTCLGVFNLLACMALCGILAGCGEVVPAESDEINQSDDFTPGIPVLDVEATPAWSGDTSGIDLYLRFHPSSLTFVRTGSSFSAMFELAARIRDMKTRALVLDRVWWDTTVATAYAFTQREEPIVRTRRIALLPGEYVLEVQIEDMNTGKMAMRRRAITVPDLIQRRPSLGEIRLQTRTSSGAYVPLVEFHFPLDADSLRAFLETYNVPTENPGNVRVALVAFKYDTLAALPPYLVDEIGATLPMGHWSANFELGDTLYKAVIPSIGDDRRRAATCSLPRLREGIYELSMRSEVAVPGEPGKDSIMEAHRVLSVKGIGFPKPSTLDDLVEEAVYIASRDDMRELLSAQSQEEKRRRFDSLWLSFTHDPKTAASLLRKYYTRVEQANRFFTSTKEGWKTDRGMLYIVFGPPGQMDRNLDVQNWYYDLPGTSDDNKYSFKRVYSFGPGVSFENYVLYRAYGYESMWDRMVAKWRSGDVY